MLNAIKNSPYYLQMKAQMASEAARASGNPAGESATAQVTEMQKIREAIALALLRKEDAPPPSMRETALNEVYRASGDLRKMETFDGNLNVWACLDESSTPEKPVVYMEIETDGTRTAHLVDVGSVNPDSITRFEALALVRCMQNDPSWSDLTYTDMLNAISSLVANDPGGKDQTPTDIVDQIGSYCKPTFTYNRDGAYDIFGGGVSSLDQNRELRVTERALKMQSLMSNIFVDEGGKKTLAKGFYL